MSAYLDYEDLKAITNRTGSRVSKAQVIADLTKMGFPHEVNARGYPYSSATALDKKILGRSSRQSAEPPKPRQIKIG